MKTRFIILSLLLGFGSSNILHSQSLDWVNVLGSPQLESFGEFKVDDIGNIYSLCSFSGQLDLDPDSSAQLLTPVGAKGYALIKYSPLGDLIWARWWERPLTSSNFGVIHRDLELDGLGNVFITGYFDGFVDLDPSTGTAFSATTAGSYIVKMDTTGNFQWAKIFSPTVNGSTSFGIYLEVDFQGNPIISGEFNGTIDLDPASATSHTISGFFDGFVVKLDPNGNFLWGRSFGNSGQERVFGLAVDDSANVYLNGFFSGSIDFNQGGTPIVLTSPVNSNGGSTDDGFLQKISPNGNVIWVKHFTGSAEIKLLSLMVDEGQNIFVSGNFYLGDFDADPGPGTAIFPQNGFVFQTFIVKLDSIGNYKWGVLLEPQTPSSSVRNYVLSPGLFSSIYVMGRYGGTVDFEPGPNSTLLTANQHDGFVLQLDSAGNLLDLLNFTASDDLEVSRARLGANQELLVSGFFNGVADLDPSNGTFASTSLGGLDGFLLSLDLCGPTDTSFVINACSSIIFNGVNYDSSGVYTQTYINQRGCDSLVTLDLTIAQAQDTLVPLQACDSLFLLGTYYTNSQLVYDTIPNVFGCDSLWFTYDLQINSSDQVTIDETACEVFNWQGVSYIQSGQYSRTFTNTNGCDSMVTLNLTIESLDVGVLIDSSQLVAASVGTAYQWIDCDTGLPITGANSQSFTPSQSGNYALFMENGPCSDTSECVNFLTTDIEKSLLQALQVFPNPTQGSIQIKWQQPQAPLLLTVYNDKAQLVYQRNLIGQNLYQIDLPPQSGLYFVKVASEYGTRTWKIMKEK